MLRAPSTRLEEVCEIRHSEGVEVGIALGDGPLGSGARTFAGKSAVALKTVDAPAICFLMVRRSRHHSRICPKQEALAKAVGLYLPTMEARQKLALEIEVEVEGYER